MERTYTILLDRGAREPTRRLCGKSAFGPPPPADPPRPVLHREKLTTQELLEFSQEPDFVAAAEVMRTRLPAPLRPTHEGPGQQAQQDRRPRPCWGIGAVGADRSKLSGADVPVALLDTGIDSTHAAFRGVELVERDFTGCGKADQDGHGTHAAGVIFGRSVEGMRIGVAPGVPKALIGKVLHAGEGDTDMLARGLVWAHEGGARVIAFSARFDFAATVEERRRQGWRDDLATAAALEAYRANIRLLDQLLEMLSLQEPFTGGAMVIVPSGDDSCRGEGRERVMTASPPAGSERIVCVGSLEPDPHGAGYHVSDFSNAGVQVCAPGGRVASAAIGGGIATRSGTSVAAAHAAGVAALWWQAVRQSELPANATVIRGRLIGAAETGSLSAAVYPGERGAGCVAAPSAERLAAPAVSDGWHSGRGPVGDVAWVVGRAGRAAAQFDPLPIQFARSAAAPGGRRNLC